MSEFFEHSQDAVTASLDGGVVILLSSSNRYFRLDGVGALVWSGIGEGQSRDEIIERVVQSYSVDRAIVAHDLDQLFAQLLGANLIAHAQ